MNKTHRFLSIFVLIISTCTVCGQSKNPVWIANGSDTYTFGQDSICKVNGNYSLFVEYNGSLPSVGAWEMTFPNRYSGKEITMTCDVRTENVEQGDATPYLMFPPTITYDSMKRIPLSGSHQWSKYAITYDIPSTKQKYITIGLMLRGSGKVWIDNVCLSVDGVSVVDSQSDLTEFGVSYPPSMQDQIGINTISDEMIARLSVQELTNIGLIWGYLKYYHPNIRQGKFNWDKELIELLKRYSSANTEQDKYAVLIKWIDDLGTYEQTKYDIDSCQVTLYPDLKWMSSSGFPTALSDQLISLRTAKRGNDCHYMHIAHWGLLFDANVTNELPIVKPYRNIAGRLLSLYRYWNLIQYYFPYRHLVGRDWKTVLTEFIPLLIRADNDVAYNEVMVRLFCQIHDSHAYAMVYPITRYHVGHRMAACQVKFIENKAVVTGFYNDSIKSVSPLKIGDEIVAIDHKPISQMINERMDLYPASNYPTKLRSIAYHLLFSHHQKIVVSVASGQHIIDKEIDTYDPLYFHSDDPDRPDTCFRMLPDSMAYIHIGTLTMRTLNDIYPILQRSKGWILDLRCYPADSRTWPADSRTWSWLKNQLNEITVPCVKHSLVNTTNPGLFQFYDIAYNIASPQPYTGKIVILTDETTQSQAELAVMHFRASPNSISIGSQTAGADGHKLSFTLFNNTPASFSITGIYYPNGGETQRIGLIPDLYMTPTIQSIKEGRDMLLEKAVELINNPTLFNNIKLW